MATHGSHQPQRHSAAELKKLRTEHAEREQKDAARREARHLRLEHDAHEPHHLSASTKEKVKTEIDAKIVADRVERKAARAARKHQRNAH